MFDNIAKFLKKFVKSKEADSKETAKERLHLVLMQDRANVSADFLDLMKQEIIDVIKKYIDVDENSIDVKLTNKTNGDGTTGAPILYANIPIVSIKDENKVVIKEIKKQANNQKANVKKEQVEAIATKEEKDVKDKEIKKENQKEDKKENKQKQEENKNTVESAQKVEKEEIQKNKTQQNVVKKENINNKQQITKKGKKNNYHQKQKTGVKA